MNAGATARARGGWIVAIAIWAPVFWRLRPAWSVTEQAHGWVVPVLAAFLALERWRRDEGSGTVRATGGRATIGAWIAVVVGLLVQPVLLAVLEANPLWPAAQWAAYAAAAAVTLGWLALTQRPAAARRMVFPVAFISTALTWPAFVTVRVAVDLGACNARLAAAAVSAMSAPAVVHGNVIEVAGGLLGVDEACSGVRSLPAVWMAAWFLGELAGLTWRRRLGLVVASLSAAVVGNLIRTTALTALAAGQGVAAVERWHDAAGGLELAGTLATVVALAWILARGRSPGQSVPAPEQAAGSVGLRAARACVTASLVVLVGCVVAVAGPELWYRAHETRAGAGESTLWELRQVAGWNEIAVPARAQELLHASAAQGRERFDPEFGARDAAFVLRWEGDVASAAAAELHDPTICLPAAGIAVETVGEPEVVAIAGERLAFTDGSYAIAGRGQHVFFCRWDARLGRARSAQPADLADVVRWRLERVAAGQRRGAVAFIVLVVPTGDDVLARRWLREWAPRLLQRRT